MKKKNPKKGVVALMIVLILGTLVLVVSVSQLAYSMWTKQSLEWSIIKYQNAARASSASLYMSMNLFRDRDYSGTDVATFYLTQLDKIQNAPLTSGISTITTPTECATKTCKQISTTFTKNQFAISQIFYFVVDPPALLWLGLGMELPNFHIPLLRLFQGLW